MDTDGSAAPDDEEEGGDAGVLSPLAAYLSTVETVMSNRKIYQKSNTEEDIDAVRDYLLSIETAAPTDLPTLSCNVPDPSSSTCRADDGAGDDDTSKIKRQEESLRRELESQRSSFLSAVGWGEGSPGPERHKLLVRVLSYVGNHCAKYGDAMPLLGAWEKIKESGAVPRDNVLSTFLYVLSSVGGGGEVEVEDGGADIPQEIATFHDILFRPTEKTVSLRVKAFVARGNAKGAEDLLRSMPDDSNSSDLKLRTYLPILELYCQQGNIPSAMNLYKRMMDSAGVIFEAENYSMLIAAVAENGFFRSDADPIEGAADLGYPPACGPALLDQLASQMAEDVLEITSACARRLAGAFAAGFDGASPGANVINVDDAASSRGEGGELDDLELDSRPAGPDELVASRVLVDGSTASCPRTGARLRLVALDDEQRGHVHDTLLGMANDQYEAYSAKLAARNHDIEEVNDDYASRHLRRFAEWLDEREGEPFTAVVDGANVAFFGQGVVNHYQVHLVVDALEKMGETPLVVLPQKYAAKKFYIRKGFVQELPQEQLNIIEKLEKEGKLYKVPKRCLDDYYWMLASVSNQTASRNDTNLDVAPNSAGRWPGLRPIIISNDRMRDHKLELLQPHLFRRWYSSHMIRYEFSHFEDNELDRDIRFSAADFFSREIQANPAPGAGSGGFTGKAWHFPVSDWEWNERFCLRVPYYEV